MEESYLHQDTDKFLLVVGKLRPVTKNLMQRYYWI